MAAKGKKKSFFGGFNDIPDIKGDEYTGIDLDTESIAYSYEKKKEFNIDDMLSGQMDEMMSQAAGVEFVERKEEPTVVAERPRRSRPVEALELPDNPDDGWGEYTGSYKGEEYYEPEYEEVREEGRRAFDNEEGIGFDLGDGEFEADMILDIWEESRVGAYDWAFSKYTGSDLAEMQSRLNDLAMLGNRNKAQDMELQALAKKIKEVTASHDSFKEKIPYSQKQKEYLSRFFKHYFKQFMFKKNLSPQALFFMGLILKEIICVIALVRIVLNSKN